MNPMDIDKVLRFQSEQPTDSAVGALPSNFDANLAYKAKADDADFVSQKSSSYSKQEVGYLIQALAHRDQTIETLSQKQSETAVQHDRAVSTAKLDAEVKLSGVQEVNDSLRAQVEALSYVVEHGESQNEQALNFSSKVSAATDMCRHDEDSIREQCQQRHASFVKNCDTLIESVESLANDAAATVDSYTSPKRVMSCVDDVYKLSIESHARKLDLLSDRVQQQIQDEVGTHFGIHLAFSGGKPPEFVTSCVATDIVAPCANELVATLAPTVQQTLAEQRNELLSACEAKSRKKIEAFTNQQLAMLQENQRSQRMKEVLSLCAKKENDYQRVLEQLRRTRSEAVSARERDKRLLTAKFSALKLRFDEIKKANDEMRLIHSQMKPPAAQPDPQPAVQKTESPLPEAHSYPQQSVKEQIIAVPEPYREPLPEPAATRTSLLRQQMHRSTPHASRSQAAHQVMKHKDVRDMFGSLPSSATLVQDIPREELEKMMKTLRPGDELVVKKPKKKGMSLASRSDGFSRSEQVVMQELRRLRY